MRLTAEQRIEWLQVIWANFQKKAGTRRDMTSSEYHVAGKWLDRGLPLVVVLRALQDFKGKPRRLEALESAVEEAAAYHYKAVGGLTSLPEAGALEDGGHDES